MLFFLVASVALAPLPGSAKAESVPGSAKVESVPGFEGKLCWDSFSGYLPTASGKSLFYWYHEAVEDAANKPWILWLNGGPGCSSLGGMFTELGPFVVGSGGNVTLNPFAWNTVANVLFLEQPAGVGFSYGSLAADDNSTATDTNDALRAFIALHPELRGRDFFVLGESYGGHYVPNTVRAVQEGNAALPAGSAKKINLRGFAVGNGYTDWALDFNANVPNGRYHALTSQKKFDAADKACGGDFARCFWPRPDVHCPIECDWAVGNATIEATDGSIDIYDIYEDVCLADEAPRTQMSVLEAERRRALERSRAARAAGGAEPRTAAAPEPPRHQHRGREARVTISPVFGTCIDSWVASYLNRADVQASIHVKPSTIPGGKWSDCSPLLNYTFNYESELPNYEKWVSEGELQMLVYNGDADYILSHKGNAAWIEQGLGLDTSKEWAKWRGSDGQVAGYVEVTVDIVSRRA